MTVTEPSNPESADVIAINQLAHAYAQGISRGDIHQAVQVYAPDAVLTTPVVDAIRGRDNIEAVIRDFTKDLTMVFHCVQNSLVRVAGDQATASFQLSEWTWRASDQQALLWLGFYDDELVRLPQGWRFSRRSLVPRLLTKSDLDFSRFRAVPPLPPSLA